MTSRLNLSYFSLQTVLLGFKIQLVLEENSCHRIMYHNEASCWGWNPTQVSENFLRCSKTMISIILSIDDYTLPYGFLSVECSLSTQNCLKCILTKGKFWLKFWGWSILLSAVLRLTLVYVTSESSGWVGWQVICTLANRVTSTMSIRWLPPSATKHILPYNKSRWCCFLTWLVAAENFQNFFVCHLLVSRLITASNQSSLRRATNTSCADLS